MFAEDRVLVGVVNRKRDLQLLMSERWYRVPQRALPNGIFTDYVAFFLSGGLGVRGGAIYYYAPRVGLELALRRDLLPAEPSHPRADEVYYRIALGDIQEKLPPVKNTSHRPITFIYTTWDRFSVAKTIRDLYSKNTYFVDRVYYARPIKGKIQCSLPMERWSRGKTPTEF